MPAIRIGQLARSTGHSVPTLRFYEASGLLTPTGRSEAGYRLYGDDAATRLRFIERARSLGLTLAEIRQLIESPGSAAEEHARLRHMVAHKLAEIRKRQQELANLETELDRLYVRLLRTQDPPCGHLGDCECWLPTTEEKKTMTDEIICCGQICDPSCACGTAQECDSDQCCGGPDAVNAQVLITLE